MVLPEGLGCLTLDAILEKAREVHSQAVAKCREQLLEERGKAQEAVAERDELRSQLQECREQLLEERGEAQEVVAERDEVRSQLQECREQLLEERGKAQEVAAERDDLRSQLQECGELAAENDDELRRQLQESCQQHQNLLHRVIRAGELLPELVAAQTLRFGEHAGELAATGPSHTGGGSSGAAQQELLLQQKHEEGEEEEEEEGMERAAAPAAAAAAAGLAHATSAGEQRVEEEEQQLPSPQGGGPDSGQGPWPEHAGAAAGKQGQPQAAQDSPAKPVGRKNPRKRTPASLTKLRCSGSGAAGGGSGGGGTAEPDSHGAAPEVEEVAPPHKRRRLVNHEMKEGGLKLLQKLRDCNKLYSYYFRDVPDDVLAPGYSSTIERPVSLSTIERRLQADAYASDADLLADFELLFSNCRLYNTPAAEEGDDLGRYLVHDLLPQLELSVFEYWRKFKIGSSVVSARVSRTDIYEPAWALAKVMEDLIFPSAEVLFKKLKEAFDPADRPSKALLEDFLPCLTTGDDRYGIAPTGNDAFLQYGKPPEGTKVEDHMESSLLALLVWLKGTSALAEPPTEDRLRRCVRVVVEKDEPQGRFQVILLRPRLHAAGLYPEAWKVPLVLDEVRAANAAAAQSAAAAASGVVQAAAQDGEQQEEEEEEEEEQQQLVEGVVGGFEIDVAN